LQTVLKRLGDRYVWQELDEAEYRSERRKIEQRLAELPLPVDSNVIAFDAAAATLSPMGDVIRAAEPGRQQAIVRHIVEGVEIAGGAVVGIAVRLEARPFFADFPAVVEAPPDGSEALTTGWSPTRSPIRIGALGYRRTSARSRICPRRVKEDR
jgi:hypothetical protein